MALTIKSSPSDTSSVSSEMLFVIDEATKAHDAVTYPNYRYILDIYVSSVLVARLRAVPDPTYGFGVFDVSSVLQNYVPEYGLDVSTGKVDYSVRLEYQCKLGEEYSDTTYLNLVTDSNRYTFKTYKPRPFTSSSIIANGLASNMPDTVNVYTPSVYKLIPYFSNVSGVTDLTVTYKDKNDNTIGASVFDNSDFVANKIRQFNIENSSALTAYALLTGPFSLRLNYFCSKYPSFTLVWLNPYGGYDSQDFWLVSKKSSTINRKSYQQLPYKIDSNGAITYASSTPVFYGGTRAFAATSKDKMLLTSNILSDDEYTWLAELFSSPDVYISSSAGFVPVIITETNYEYRTFQNSKLTPLQLTVEFADSFNAQLL